MSDEMPNEIWAWRTEDGSQPKKYRTRWFADKPTWQQGDEPAHYVRADLHAAEAKALTDRIKRIKAESTLWPTLWSDLLAFLRKQSQ